MSDPALGQFAYLRLAIQSGKDARKHKTDNNVSKKRIRGERRSRTAEGPGPSGTQSSRRGRGAARARRPFAKRPVLRFVVLFVVFLGAFQLIMIIPFVKDTVFPKYLRVNAQVSGAIIGIFETGVHVNGNAISSPHASLSIARGCDAVEPSALFVAGVLAFPAALVSKIPGMLLGTVCLMVLNLARIVSLFYVRKHIPSVFEVMHIDVWQTLFVLLAILFWILWAMRAVRSVGPIPDATPSTG